MAYLVMILLHYFLSTCLVTYIFKKLLILYTVDVLLFINDYFRNLPFVVLLLLRLGDVGTNPGPKKILSYQVLSLKSKWSSCP